jgi:predicted peptidase
VISAAIIVSALLAVSTEDVTRLLKERECRYTGGSYHNELFHYRLFVPSSLNQTRYPLLVWLHGLGDEIGSDNRGQLKWMDITLFAAAEPRFFVLAVQCPKANPTWFHVGGDRASDMLSVTADILRKTLRECPIDPDRVYVTGISGGATGCWEMALRYPEMFAAVVPMGGGGGDLSRAARLRDVPVWAFHFSNDGNAPSKDDENMVGAMKTLGGNAHLTIREAAPGQWAHNCWEPAFKQYKVMSWMLSQHRGGRCWLPPGCRPWKWRHILAMPAGFLAIAWLAWSRAKRKHSKPLPSDGDFILCLPEEKVAP